MKGILRYNGSNVARYFENLSKIMHLLSLARTHARTHTHSHTHTHTHIHRYTQLLDNI